jgi:hypothetical protein
MNKYESRRKKITKKNGTTITVSWVASESIRNMDDLKTKKIDVKHMKMM